LRRNILWGGKESREKVALGREKRLFGKKRRTRFGFGAGRQMGGQDD